MPVSGKEVEGNLKEAVRRRGAVKGKLTRFCTFFNGFAKKENGNFTELKLRCDKLNALYDEFDVVQTEIEEFDESAEQQTERLSFENDFFSIQAAAADEYEKHVASKSVAGRTSNQQEDTQIFQLPRISLPEFSGGYEKWQSFRDNFTVIVHNKKNVPAVQKLQYLRLALKGTAAQLIDCLEITDANYQVAWSLLCERFENKRLIVQSHLSKLFTAPRLEKESATELRNFYDTFTRHLGALKAVGEGVDGWSTILVFLATSKLDAKSTMEWEVSRKDTSVPAWAEFEKFLSHRCHALDAFEVSKTQPKISSNQVPVPSTRRAFTTFRDESMPTNESVCYICKVAHALYQCPKFLGLRTPDKVKTARAANVCLNCLRTGHRASTCRSSGCQKCHKRHNSKLHLEEEEREEAFANNVIIDQPANQKEQVESEEVEHATVFKAQVGSGAVDSREVAMLSTALVIINDVRHKKIIARVLLDSGSQANLMTMKLATKLGYPIKPTEVTIRGVSGDPCKPLGETSATIKSRLNAFEANLKFFVMQNVAGPLPSVDPEEKIMNMVKRSEYADPEVCSTRKIDMIVGTQIFFQLLCIGQLRPIGTNAIWQKTVFGWVLTGHLITKEPLNCLSVMAAEDESIQEQLRKFWEIEEVVNSSSMSRLSIEERKCEEHFVKTCRRGNDGRFTLELPFRENVRQLGESRTMAEKRFYSMERKLEANPELKDEYVKFMREYHHLGHMKLNPNKYSDQNKGEGHQLFLPHHAVVRHESSTTKVRVVFDASSKTSTSVSLNDTLMVGPTIQEDLRAILLRFRIHEVVITADVEKMYRQIAISPQCQSFQQILWRENKNDPLVCYRLQTVTYGTSAAPFMAIRTLHQLAECEKENFPEASHIAKRDFYVDDLLTGAASINDASELQRDMLKMCERGGFSLRKWCSNHDELLENVPNAMRAASHNFDFKDEVSTKTLGVRWKPKEDKLHFMVLVTEPLSSCTKRNVVSEMSRLFDPLGLVSPVIVKAKIFVQQLWKLKLSWDESLPIEYHTAWENYRKELTDITEVQIPRRVTASNGHHYSLHIFCDASQAAYGACAYVRTTTVKDDITSQLLMAKSRVCPVKATTIPRLELCAALLAAKLMTVVRQALLEVLSFNSITFWTDSSIVVNWVQSREPSSRWKTFVANRIQELRDLTTNCSWRHVKGADNPADHVSRGLRVKELINCHQWWSGPKWLASRESEWPGLSVAGVVDDLIERRKEVTVMKVNVEVEIDLMEVLSRFSRLERLYRTTAYLFRGVTPKILRATGEITSEEINKCSRFWIKIIQKSSFPVEITELRLHKTLVRRASQLQSLSPFLDVDGILRVGGRLQNTDEPYSVRHPILLPADTHLSELIVESEHRRLIHAGPQHLIASLRRRFWILSIRRLVQKIIFRCSPCYRWKIQGTQQAMGSLPRERVNPSPVFDVCGVDYAGPFKMRYGPPRSKQIFKAYVAIFVCFSTKAIHLEWVDDLTSDSFLATLRCFIARRGCPSKIYSDNGRNFVGAAAQLKSFLASPTLKQKLGSYAAQSGLSWSFIPPHSPHMGGLWEAGVKSMKFHLRRSLGETTLSQREANTLLSQIESVLNSRPLVASSNDPNDLEALTPGHFLIGRPLTAVSEPCYAECKSLKVRWHKVQQLVQQFWQRWRTEYLQSLQNRSKWSKVEENLRVGDLVLIREDFETPLAWRKGRIIQVHAGSDNLVRVVTLKTEAGEVKRPVHKVALLPFQRTELLNPQEV